MAEQVNDTGPKSTTIYKKLISDGKNRKGQIQKARKDISCKWQPKRELLILTLDFK